jgi:organic radical activating enzyme
MTSRVIKIESTQKSNTLDIRWTPNNVCNFRCRYCFPDSNTGDYGSPKDINLTIKNFNFLLKQYREKLGKTRTHLKIAGGEPTLWRDLDIFITEIKKENDIYVSLITNGSRTIRWWKEHGHIIDNVHLTHHVAQADLDHTIAVADTMYDLGKKITVKVLMDLTCWEKCIEAVEYLKRNSKNKFIITVAEVIEPEIINLVEIKTVTGKDLKYSEEQKKYLKKGLRRIPGPWWFWKNRHLITSGEIRLYESIATLEDGSKLKARSETYINRNLNGFKGWSCNIGIEGIFIDWKGDIKGSCNEFVYGLDYYYNILDKDFTEKFVLNPVPAICSKFSCYCSPETHISKIKI